MHVPQVQGQWTQIRSWSVHCNRTCCLGPWTNSSRSERYYTCLTGICLDSKWWWDDRCGLWVQRWNATHKTPNLMHVCSGEEYYDASVAQACHETLNSRFKSKQVLVKHFRHSLAFHLACFCPVAVITQLNIEAGESLLPVQYIDDGWRIKRTN